MAKRIPDSVKPSKAKLIKSAHRKAKSKLPLKVFAASTPSLAEANVDWRHNKKCNPSNPPQGIGNTHKVKTKQAKPKTTDAVIAK